MTFSTPNEIQGQVECPSRSEIEKEKQQHDDMVLAIRQILAASPSPENLIRCNAA